MLFAISGSQGSGKSTVIEELKKRGFPVVERKTSRSIMDEWRVTLSEVNNDRELTVKFQDEILERKIQDERGAVESQSTIWFTERTYADLFTYALIAIGKDNEYSEWLNGYYDRCYKAQFTYKHNFYLTGGLFAVEKDGVRGSNQYYARMVDIVMRDVTKQMSAPIYDVMDPMTDAINGPSTHHIHDKDLNVRVDNILMIISEFI